MSTIPYGTNAFDIEFDFIDHQLLIRSSTGASRMVALERLPNRRITTSCQT